MNFIKPLYKISYGVIWFFSILILGLLTILNLKFSTYIIGKGEHVKIYNTDLFTTILFIILFLCLFYLIIRFSDKIDEKKLLILFLVLYCIAGFYLIFNISPVLRYDAQHVYNASVALHRKDFSILDPGRYMYMYPHQFGLLIYEYIIGFVSYNPKIFFCINLVEIFIINIFSYKITKEIFHNNHCINLISITLSFLFLPQFFFLTFAYGLIPGFCLLIIGIYYMQVFTRTLSYQHLILSCLFVVASVLMKKNFIIGMVACMCYLLILFFKKKEKKLLIYSVITVICFLISKSAMLYGIQSYTGKQTNDGVPSILWVAMGTDPHNHQRAGGWYNNQYLKVYRTHRFDEEKSSEIGREMVFNNMHYYKENPDKAIDFFSKKITSTWTDSLYESIWTGPKQVAGQYVSTEFLHQLYNEKESDSTVYIVMKAFFILLFATAFLFVCKDLKKYDAAFYGLIFLIGGFLFHLFWETKSQYVYPYIFLQIPICASVFVKIFKKILPENINKK